MVREGDPRERVARAAYGLTAALGVWAAVSGGLRASYPPIPCACPVEISADDGRTTALRCLPCPAVATRPVRGAARLLVGRPVDLACADARTLEVLPGIGASRAAAIVGAVRAGRVRSVDELDAVTGIGARTKAAVRSRLTHSGRLPASCDAQRGTVGPDPDRVGRDRDDR